MATHTGDAAVTWSRWPAPPNAPYSVACRAYSSSNAKPAGANSPPQLSLSGAGIAFSRFFASAALRFASANVWDIAL